METLIKHRKQIVIAIITYFVVGIIASISQYFITNPALLEPCPEYVAQFKCINTSQRIADIIFQPYFWIALPLWPFTFIFGIFFAN